MKNYVRFILGLLFVGIFGLFIVPRTHIQRYYQQASRYITSFFQTSELDDTSCEHRINVFIHGTFATLVGLLSFSDVINGKVKGTLYKKVAKKMRKNPKFYTEQPILELGLKKITPTFDVKDVTSKKCAAYPILKAYQTVLDSVEGKCEQNHFYTFGWSGLISQDRRRSEAFRLYNALSEEVEQFRKRGIDPKIRLISHSHGGNLCLNLAAIEMLLNVKGEQAECLFSGPADRCESLKAMFDILKALPHKENAFMEKGQKRYDYIPYVKDLRVEELILLGTPIQPETQHFCESPLFKKVYHFYSDEDKIQTMDFVTTKRSFSDRRFEKPCKNLVQVRVMYDRNLLSNSLSGTAHRTAFSEQGREKPSFWKQLISCGNFFGKKKKDPNHKELWFLSWDDNSDTNSCLLPLPTVTILPLLLGNIKTTTHDIFDVDLNITTTGDSLCVSLLKHGDSSIISRSRIARSIIEQLKQQIRQWKPEKKSNKFSFDSLYRSIL